MNYVGFSFFLQDPLLTKVFLVKVTSIAAMWLQDIAYYCQLIVDTVVSQWLRMARDWR